MLVSAIITTQMIMNTVVLSDNGMEIATALIGSMIGGGRTTLPLDPNTHALYVLNAQIINRLREYLFHVQSESATFAFFLS